MTFPERAALVVRGGARSAFKSVCQIVNGALFYLLLVYGLPRDVKDGTSGETLNGARGREWRGGGQKIRAS